MAKSGRRKGGVRIEEEASQMVEEALGLICLAGDGAFGNEAFEARKEEDSDDETIICNESDEDEGIKSFSHLSDAVEELAVQQHEAQSNLKRKKKEQKTKSVVHRLLEEALSLPSRAKGKKHSSKGRVIKKKKAFDEYVSLDILPSSTSASEVEDAGEETETEISEMEMETETETESEGVRTSKERSRKTQKKKKKKKKRKNKLSVRVKNVSLGSKRNRTITLNFLPKSSGKGKWSLRSYLKDGKGTLHLPGGKSVVIRGENEPFLGVDNIAGRYRSRFASKYLGRYTTAKEAAISHDLAAISCLERELKEYFSAETKTKTKTNHSKQKRRTKTAERKKKDVVKEIEQPPPIYASDLDEDDLRPVPFETKGTHMISWESSVSLNDKDVSLSTSKLTIKLPEEAAEMLLFYDRGQYFTAEMRDERGQVFMCKAYLMSASVSRSVYLSLIGQWGHYARSRQLSATDTIFFLFSMYRRKRNKCFPFVNLAAQLRVKRSVIPPRVTILEPNVESELNPEALGFCYVPGRLPSSVVKNALRKIKSTRELVEVIRHEQQTTVKAVKYRMRIVPVDPKRGFGLWILQEIPRKGEILFEYAGEILSPQEAGRREKGYLLNPNIQNYIYEGGRNAKSKDGDCGKPKIILDSTFFGNVSRFCNHRCVDSNLEVEYAKNRILFKTRRTIFAGEELTVDYSPAKSVNELKKTVKCYCGSTFCRGWIF